MRPSRLAAVLAAALTAPLAMVGTAHADGGTDCTVQATRAYLPSWTIGCNSASTVTAHVVYDYQNGHVPPSQSTEDQTYSQNVDSTSPWQSSVMTPSSWYVFHGCTTFAAGGTQLATNCFDRPDPAHSTVSPCGVGTMSTLSPSVTAGCPRADATVYAEFSYDYTTPDDPTSQHADQVLSQAVARGNSAIITPTLPDGAVLLDSTVTVTDDAGNQIGTATFTRN